MNDNSIRAALITGGALILAAFIGGAFSYVLRPHVSPPPDNAEVNSKSSLSKTPAAIDSELRANRSIFNETDPVPVGLEAVRIGTPASTLFTAFPNGVLLSPHRYIVVLDKGPFKKVEFIYYTVKKDLIVTGIFYDFRDSSAKESVYQQALQTFGKDRVLRKDGGETLEWPDINGYQLTLNKYSYSLFNYRVLLR